MAAHDRLGERALMTRYGGSDGPRSSELRCTREVCREEDVTTPKRIVVLASVLCLPVAGVRRLLRGDRLKLQRMKASLAIRQVYRMIEEALLE